MRETSPAESIVVSLVVARSRTNEAQAVERIEYAIDRIMEEWGETGTVLPPDAGHHGSDEVVNLEARTPGAGDPSLPEFADVVSVGLLLHDADTGAILDANTAVQDLYGYSAQELREIGVGEFSSEAERFSQEAAQSRIRATVEQGEQSFEWQVKRANGEIRWVHVTLSVCSIGEDRCVLAEVHDITEYKSRERRLGLLYRIIRHNLRNRMNLVLAHAAELKEALNADDLETQAAIILDVASDVARMTESVRAIERFASGATPELSPRNLRTVVNDIIADLDGEDSDIELSVMGDDGVFVTGGEGLEIALREAIQNAVEHSPDEPTEVTVTIRADTTRPRAIVEIVDENPCIPEIERNAILDHYDGSPTDHGSGVGLFVSKWCAESLGGDLEIRENEPRGNVLRFVFPLLRDPSDAR